MKIGFDAKRAAQNRTGLGNYSRFVIRILSQYHTGNDYVLYVPDKRRTPYLNEIPTLTDVTVAYPSSGAGRRLPSAWRVWGVTAQAQADGIELFHGLSNELPLNAGDANFKKVVTIHDLIVLSHPEFYPAIDRRIYAYKIRRACKTADRIIAVSRHTARELVARCNVGPDKIDVVYQGCDPAFGMPITQEKLDEVRHRFRLPQRYLLYVGTIEERKNMMLAVKALHELKLRNKLPDDMKLVIVGRATPYLDKIKAYIAEHKLTERVTMLHNVPFADLPSVYRMAWAFVYPSVVEGFGIPLLEAITSEIPAIGCTGSCLEEAGGPESLYVSPDRPGELADAMLRVWNDSDLRERMIKAGREYARQFSDEVLSDQLMEVYRRALGEK